MKENNKIIPRKLSGFMELSPSKQMVFNGMIDKIENIYKKFSFLPIDTPVLELSEILLAKSGGEIDKELYHFTKGDTNVCMRYDLTVPLARYVAMYGDTLNFPFKRYQIGKVFRGERAQKGRFREFIQCDADIIGLDTLPIIADAECLNIADKVFQSLGLDIVTHISNRNILFGYCEALGFKEQTSDILIVLDKVGKIGKENAVAELLNIGLSSTQAQNLITLTLKCGRFDEVLSDIHNLTDNETYQKGISELKELSLYLKAYNIEEGRYALDIGIIRGHNYYTGTVFESVLPSHPEFGSVCAGGRYDNLAGYYTDKHLPGVGLSIGITRLFDTLDRNGMLEEVKPTNIDLQIIPLGDTLLHCLELQSFFQQHMICDVNYDTRSFKGKMKEANKRQIPYILVVGENEVNTKTYSLKNMVSGEQFNLSKEDCLKQILK